MSEAAGDSNFIGLVAQIVSAYVGNHTVPSAKFRR